MGICVKRFQKTSVEEMKKQSNELYNKVTAYEDQLIAAFKGGKLKSKAKKDEAKSIIKIRESKKKKAQEKKNKAEKSN